MLNVCSDDAPFFQSCGEQFIIIIGTLCFQCTVLLFN